MTDKILILDFGSQVTQLIARRVREAGVYCEIMPFNVDPQRIVDFAPRGIILSGGPASVTKDETPRAPDIAFKSACRLLGICYGQQAMCEQLGGKVESSDHHEFGRAYVDVTDACALVRRRLEKGRPRAGVDEPWRPGDEAAAGLSRGGRQRGRALRHRRRRCAQVSTA